MAALVSGLDEYAKVLSGGTGSAAASSDASRAQAMALIPKGATTDQVPEIVNVLKQGMEFKRSSYQDKIEEVTNKIGAPIGQKTQSSSRPTWAPPEARQDAQGRWIAPQPNGKWHVILPPEGQ